MGGASQDAHPKADASSTVHEDNLPTSMKLWEPVPDGHQLYKPKKGSHICAYAVKSIED